MIMKSSEKSLDTTLSIGYTTTMTTENTLSPHDCLDAGPLLEGCAGDVQYRIAMSATGRSFPRCDAHFESRWQTQQEISHRYGVPLTYYGNDRDGWDDDYSDY